MYSLSHNHSLQSDPISQLATGTLLSHHSSLHPSHSTQNTDTPTKRQHKTIGAQHKEMHQAFLRATSWGGAPHKEMRQTFLRTTQAGVGPSL